MTPTPEIVRETIQARYYFTDREKQALGESIANRMSDYKRIDADFDRVKLEYKSKLETCDNEAENAASKLRDGFEVRPTVAQVIFNVPSPGRKTYFHNETGEAISEEAMSYDDQQRPLFKGPDGGDATAPKQTLEQEAREFVLGKTVEDPEGNPVELETPPPSATNLGDALGAAATKTDAPQFVLDIDKPDWVRLALSQAWKKAARDAGWTQAQIATLKGVLKECDSVQAMISTLRPHVIVPAAQSQEPWAPMGVECPACGSVSFDGTPCDCKGVPAPGSNPDEFGPEETTDEQPESDGGFPI